MAVLLVPQYLKIKQKLPAKQEMENQDIKQLNKFPKTEEKQMINEDSQDQADDDEFDDNKLRCPKCSKIVYDIVEHLLAHQIVQQKQKNKRRIKRLRKKRANSGYRGQFYALKMYKNIKKKQKLQSTESKSKQQEVPKVKKIKKSTQNNTKASKLQLEWLLQRTEKVEGQTVGRYNLKKRKSINFKQSQSDGEGPQKQKKQELKNHLKLIKSLRIKRERPSVKQNLKPKIQYIKKLELKPQNSLKTKRQFKTNEQIMVISSDQQQGKEKEQRNVKQKKLKKNKLSQKQKNLQQKEQKNNSLAQKSEQLKKKLDELEQQKKMISQSLEAFKKKAAELQQQKLKILSIKIQDTHSPDNQKPIKTSQPTLQHYLQQKSAQKSQSSQKQATPKFKKEGSHENMLKIMEGVIKQKKTKQQKMENDHAFKTQQKIKSKLEQNKSLNYENIKKLEKCFMINLC